MQAAEVMAQLESMGSENTRKMWRKHGAQGPLFGVKIGDMKKIVKKVKKDHALALQLYDTGNVDAMYLAGLIADEKQATREELQRWAEAAEWYMISEYTVAWLASESDHGWDLGLAWIEDDRDHVSAAGWATLGSWISIRPDETLNHAALTALLDKVRNGIQQAPNRTRYAMNGFVIAVGAYVPALTDRALDAAAAIGKVQVDLGGTACKVPKATDAINKVAAAGRIGKKRKQARC